MTLRFAFVWILALLALATGTADPGLAQGRTSDDVVSGQPASAPAPSAEEVQRNLEAARNRRSDDIVTPSSKATSGATAAQTPASGPPAESSFSPLDALTGGAVSGSTSVSAPSSVSEVAGLQTASSSEPLPQKGTKCCGNIAWTTLTNFKPAPGKDRRPADYNPIKKAAAGGREKEGGDGSLQQRIVKEANEVVGKPFKYAAGTDNGRLGCAQVVSTILKRAGVMSSVQLGVLSVISDLRRRGWKEVKPPPYEDGDVICWATYDRSGDGRVDPDTHIGIIDKRGGNTYAINNSSSQRRPVKVELSSYSYPVTTVLRKG